MSQVIESVESVAAEVQLISGAKNVIEFTGLGRPAGHFAFGEYVAPMLQGIFKHPSTVAATCRFEVQGQGAEGQNSTAWGHAIRTRVQSYVRPAKDWLGGRNWFTANSERAADLILGCFGLSVRDLYAHFGQPKIGVKYMVDLIDVVKALAPEFMPDYRAKAS